MSNHVAVVATNFERYFSAKASIQFPYIPSVNLSFQFLHDKLFK